MLGRDRDMIEEEGSTDGKRKRERNESYEIGGKENLKIYRHID